jgi:BirA family biotin operon repressor/biotin-[acetyl-CoA-carboxylase] ligase
MTLRFRIEHVAEIGSTNDAVRLRALSGEAEGLVILADRQTAGRGRRGRQWESVAGNLFVSVLLRPRRPLAEAATLGFAAAVELGHVIGPLVRSRVEHKWPNDLLIGGRKATGLLLEAAGGPKGGTDWVVLGIGVNISSHPEQGLYPTTDLWAEGADRIAPADLLDAFLGGFGPAYGQWQSDGFLACRQAWLGAAAGLGGTIQAQLEHEVIEGRFVDLDPSGALVMEMCDGSLRRIAAGDVFFPRS